MFITLSEEGRRLINKIDWFAKCYPSMVTTSETNRFKKVRIMLAEYTVGFAIDKQEASAKVAIYKNETKAKQHFDAWKLHDTASEKYAFETVIEILSVYGVTI